MTFTQEQRENFIRSAQREAEKAIEVGNPPFGAILVDENGQILVSSHNTASLTTDMTCHAEMNLIRQATRDYRHPKLHGCTVFANAAACSMCASALIQAGCRDFFYGAPFEPHTNPAASYEQLAQFCNETINIHGGILEAECKEQIAKGRQVQQGANSD